MHSIFIRIFQKILNKHAPLKQKKLRGNHASFITKDLDKTIVNKTKTRNTHFKWPSRENVLAMKSAKNVCNNFIESNEKNLFSKRYTKGLC